MAGLTLTLLTAKDALLNTQIQIQTASNNIANAENKGYARQKAVLVTNPAYKTYGGWVGTGATVSTIVQMRDRFIEQRLMNAVSDESKFSGLASELGIVSAVFPDDGETGISNALGAFWDSWDLLSQNPGGAAEQTGVYQSAESLADTIRSARTALASEADAIPGKIQDAVDQANALVNKIADINKSIMKTETSTFPANELRDQRYQALKDLSEIVPVSWSEDANGVVTVTTADQSGPVTLVTGGTVNTVLDSSTTISGGRLGGLKEALADANSYIAKLDDFAQTLISRVNSVHGQNGGPAVFTGTDARTITASTDFLSGQDPADEAARALAMGQLQGERITFADGSQATLGQYLGVIQKQIGTDVQQAQSSESFSKAMRIQLDAQQQAVSGVSIDEEMVDLIQFQHIYEAAAKVIDKTSQLLDVVINMVS
jgi:flagellar hook-associated protein 1